MAGQNRRLHQDGAVLQHSRSNNIGQAADLKFGTPSSNKMRKAMLTPIRWKYLLHLRQPDARTSTDKPDSSGAYEEWHDDEKKNSALRCSAHGFRERA